MLHAVEEFLLLRFLCDSKKMKPVVGPGPDGFAYKKPPHGNKRPAAVTNRTIPLANPAFNPLISL
jgi:hypothetical protein